MKNLTQSIVEKAEEYLKIRAGVLASEIAVERYRESHRSTMLERASKSFELLTSGAYASLHASPRGEGEGLVACRADGTSITHDEMSDGTKRQLFFVLRIAGYYEYLNEHSALPFIADDVMESFDTPRSEETFKLLAEMSEHGQVIYLTHHDHLCSAAKKVCPSVTIHEL
jgi:uncharacterized protein YhaN